MLVTGCYQDTRTCRGRCSVSGNLCCLHLCLFMQLEVRGRVGACVARLLAVCLVTGARGQPAAGVTKPPACLDRPRARAEQELMLVLIITHTS
jgi:hypothetical protein